MFHTVDGRIIQSVAFGSGPGTLVGIAGSFASWEIWQPTFEVLSEKWRVVSLDHDGVAATLPTLRGMFAFAVVDLEERKLHLARDQFGQKPLYVGRIDGDLVFCSDLGAVFAGYPGRASVKASALTHYLRRGFVAPDECILRGFTQVAPGAVYTYDLQAPGAEEIARVGQVERQVRHRAQVFV